jgi:hypothetical protein
MRTKRLLAVFFVGLAVVPLLAHLIVFVDSLRPRPIPPHWANITPTTGEPAPDFTLNDTNDKPRHFSDLLADKPILLWFGSLT